MKKTTYILLFTLLGAVSQLLVHAVVEIIYIRLLLSDFDTYGLGFSFSTWFTIHTVFTIVLLFCGTALGLWQGFYWWKRMYEKK